MITAGYAVIDVQTTGLWPDRGHRIVEVAVVHLDDQGAIENSYVTLIHPQRDFPARRMHGIRDVDMMMAPHFASVAPQLVELLQGRVIVAHHATFHVSFLVAELTAVGIASPLAPDDALCTMDISRTLLPGAGRALADSCAAFDIDPGTSHEALANATATALLLAAFLKQDPELGDRLNCRDKAANAQWLTPHVDPAEWISRGRREPSPRGFLEEAVARIPNFGTTTPIDQCETRYLGTIDQAVSNGFLTAGEAGELGSYATRLGIDSFARDILHRRYFDSLVTAVWRTMLLTDTERAEIIAVARLLRIPTTMVAWAIQPRSRQEFERFATSIAARSIDSLPALGPGDAIVFTGAMSRPREYYEQVLRDQGMVAVDAVTSTARLLVATDPGKSSGRVRKARQYGIPVVTEEQLMGALVG